MRPKFITMDLDDADPNGVFEDQTLGGAGSFTLNGAGATSGKWTSPDGFAKQIGFESTGNISGVSITVTGYADPHENIPQSETIAGPNNGTVETTYYYYSITSITADGAVGTNTEAGPVDEAASQIIPLDHRMGDVGIIVNRIGTINYTVQQTNDDIQDLGQHPLTWSNFSESALVTATTSQEGHWAAIPRACRVIVNSYSTGAALEIGITTGV